MVERDTTTGYGLLYPFRREHGDFAAGSGRVLQNSRVRKILATRAAGPNGKGGTGEYPWRGELGSLLHLVRHANVNIPGAKGDIATIYATDAVEKWESTLTVETERTTFSIDPDNSTSQRLGLYWRPIDEVDPSVSIAPAIDGYVEVNL